MFQFTSQHQITSTGTQADELEARLCKWLIDLLGSYPHMQERIDADYIDVLRQLDSIPIRLRSLGAVAGDIHNALVVWEDQRENKGIALARKSCFAVGYIIRRFQDDTELCADCADYVPQIHFLQRIIEQIRQELHSNALLNHSMESVARRDRSLEAEFSKFKFTCVRIMAGLLVRTISCVLEENPQPEPYHSTYQHSSPRIQSPRIPHSPPSLSYCDTEENVSEDWRSDYNYVSLSPPAMERKSSSYERKGKYKTPNKFTEKMHPVDTTMVRVPSTSKPASPYDTDDDDMYSPDPLPSSSKLPLIPYHHNHDAPMGGPNAMTSGSAFKQKDSRSTIAMSGYNSGGYLKDDTYGKPPGSLLRRDSSMAKCEEPEQMAPDEYRATGSQPFAPHPYPYQPYVGSIPYQQPAPHLAPSPSQYYPNQANPYYMHPGTLYQNPNHNGVNIANSFNDIGNKTYTEIVHEKKKKKKQYY